MFWRICTCLGNNAITLYVKLNQCALVGEIKIYYSEMHGEDSFKIIANVFSVFGQFTEKVFFFSVLVLLICITSLHDEPTVQPPQPPDD